TTVDAGTAPAAPSALDVQPPVSAAASEAARPADASAHAASGEPMVRARTATVTMPAQVSIGSPPAMPQDAAPVAAPARVDAVEDPTRMPGPREIPGGRPEDPAAPPGAVPSGDSRSLRRRTDVHEFALVYRIQTFVISRFGVVGTRGQWRVVEYPT